MISTNLERLQNSNERISLNIANAYVKASEKGAILPSVQNSENLASTIESIEQGSNSWQPHPDWWDIESILENDKENYVGKIICLLTDSSNSYAISMNGAAKITTSDGAEYTVNATHTWDKTKDKACSLGYKTRYLIRYYTNREDFKHATLKLEDALYVIFENLDIVVPGGMYHTSSPVMNASILEYIKFKNCTFSGSNFAFYGCAKLKGIEGYTSQDNTNMNYMYYGNTSIWEVPYMSQSPTSLSATFQNSGFNYIQHIDTSNVENFNNCFANCKVAVIDSLDFSNANAIGSMFSGTSYLVSINNISNIKINGINFSSCTRLNHDALIRILNALHDYSNDTENVHNIIFGPNLLAKLNDEEKAIGLNKNWTMN